MRDVSVRGRPTDQFGSRLTLTFVQHGLIRAALRHGTSFGYVTPEQRRHLRELCAHSGPVHEPEQFLIAFKVALIEAANDERLPFGPERNEILGRLVSAFIDELYRGEVGVEDIREPLPKSPPAASPPNLI